MTEEEIFLYIPYDLSKRTYALDVWGYVEDVVVVEENEFEVEDDGMDDGDDNNDDVVEFVSYRPSPTIPQLRESGLISHVYSRIERPRNRHQHLHLRMHRLRQQGWSERQIGRHFRNI